MENFFYVVGIIAAIMWFLAAPGFWSIIIILAALIALCINFPWLIIAIPLVIAWIYYVVKDAQKDSEN